MPRFADIKNLLFFFCNFSTIVQMKAEDANLHTLKLFLETVLYLQDLISLVPISILDLLYDFFLHLLQLSLSITNILMTIFSGMFWFVCLSEFIFDLNYMFCYCCLCYLFKFDQKALTACSTLLAKCVQHFQNSSRPGGS